jgi:hypothetical protein
MHWLTCDHATVVYRIHILLVYTMLLTKSFYTAAVANCTTTITTTAAVERGSSVMIQQREQTGSVSL